MEQTMHLARNGWRQEETDLLWKEIRSAAETGAPLRGVFEKMGEALGRKPNSVRNYYYMQLRDQAGEELRRAAPFETFTEDEVHQLLRQVLSARGKGQSVRACVMALSNGDRGLMLRYQNKYRSILRKRPELIESVCRELAEEGIPCPDTAALAIRKEEKPAVVIRRQLAQAEDADVQMAFHALEALAQRAQQAGEGSGDRLRVQRDLLLMQLEDLQLAARDVIRTCKDFLGSDEEIKTQCLPLFCQSLAEGIARLETHAG
ncbi:MAG: hypothetical protein IJD39_05505 [Clostridia bacterium]|nr:hypothetical protein [Clostridia bacterium]